MEKSESLHAVKGKSEKIVFAVFFVIFFLYALSLLYRHAECGRRQRELRTLFR